MKIKIKATSKESLCRIPRNLPNLENLLALLQPVRITIYAPTPNKEKNTRLEYLRKTMEPFQGINHLHTTINRIKRRAGLIVKRTLWEALTRYNCLKSNFTPSITGWSNPLNVTLLGPNRICLNPSSFRSNRVTKATPPKPKRTKMTEIIIHNSILTRQVLWI